MYCYLASSSPFCSCEPLTRGWLPPLSMIFLHMYEFVHT